MRTNNKTSVSSLHVKEINMNKLFTYVYSNGPVSKLDLSVNLSLSIPTVNNYLRTFEKHELIIKDGTFHSTGGRKAIAYICNNQFAYAIGVYITQSFYIVTVVNFLGQPIFSMKYPQLFSPSEEYGNCLKKSIDEALSKTKIKSNDILGIGFSLPGIIETNQDEILIKFSPSLQYNNWKFSDLGDFCQFPFVVDNDANFGGFYEAWSDSTNTSFAYLHIAGGVGGAIILNGEQYIGNTNKAAEFGHMIITPNGIKCDCGREGCLERYIRRNILSDDLGISLENFFQSVKQNSKHQQILEQYIDYLCIGISNIRLALGLDVVVAGEVIEYLLPYESIIEEKLAKIDPFEDQKYFRFSKHKKENASSVAAALKIINNFINDIIDNL